MVRFKQKVLLVLFGVVGMSAVAWFFRTADIASPHVNRSLDVAVSEESVQPVVKPTVLLPANDGEERRQARARRPVSRDAVASGSGSSVMLPGNPLHVRESPFGDAEVLAERELLTKEHTEVLTLRLLKTNLKYPLILVEESGDDDQRAIRQAMVADHVLVKLRPGVTRKMLEQMADRYQATIRREMTPGGMFLVGFEDPTLDTLNETIAAFESEAEFIAYAEPDYVVFATATTPDDPRFSELWGMQNTGQSGGVIDADIDAVEAWDSARGTDIIVGVIDTGVDYLHEDGCEYVG